MTLGQRIAQKRKELGLSQENLGEQLGVSRQAIYKWESDSAMPEVEKLMALSRLFGVSVGWLLGTEEEPAAPEALTEAQLKMVEEMVGRYLPPKPQKGRRWIAVAVAAAVCLLMGNLYRRLGELTEQNQWLQRAVGQVETSVNRQIVGISGQVESILKAQNTLTSDYKVELVTADLRENTVTFALRAVPKTYVPGMEAVFLVDCGEGATLEFPALRGEDGAYETEAVFPLTDAREVSVVFVSPDGTRATQRMESYGYYYSDTIPYINLNENFMYERVPSLDKIYLTDGSRYVWWREEDGYAFGSVGEAWPEGMESVRVEEIRIGLFRNGKLLFWAENLEGQPDSFAGDWGNNRFAAFPGDVAFSAEMEDRFVVAIFARDSYGRVFAQKGSVYGIEKDAKQRLQFIWGNDNEFTEGDPLTWDYPKDADGWPVG